MMSESLKQKMVAYYTKYYRDDCSLPDWKERVENRLHEETVDKERMDQLQQVLGLSFNHQKHCIIGAGTAGVAVVLRKYNCDVYGVEPSEEEFAIIQERCIEEGIDPNNFKKEFGERVSFSDNTFDFVHCFTVLEHVQDIEKCITEMIRIVKPGGRVYINTPNYSFPYEPHYKIFFPTFLPRWAGALYLRFLRKSPNFLKTINFITEQQIDSILNKQTGIFWTHLYHPQEISRGRLAWLFNYFKFKKGVVPNQDIIIYKVR